MRQGGAVAASKPIYDQRKTIFSVISRGFFSLSFAYAAFFKMEIHAKVLRETQKASKR